MCGIAGVMIRSGARPDQADLEAMALTIAHRGPDGFGSAVFDGAGLAHRRLAVIDLSPAGAQPMFSPDGRLCVAFNGEIYNFRSLRAELEGRGYVFRSHSDTEVILAGFLEWGTAVVTRLDGMFAIALWDTKTRALLLARDRTGKKPLYVYEDGKKLVFGSEIKALLAYPEVDATHRPEAVPWFLAHGYIPTPETSYQRIRKVKPGTWELLHADGRSTVEQYWDFPLHRPRRVESLRDAQQQLRELFFAAVKRRLESDVPLGAFLSGGIDSTLVVAAMSQLSSKPVKTFSIGFDGHPDWDETRFARIVANRYGTEHTEFKVRPENFELIEKLAWHYDEPFGDSSAIPTYIVSKLTRGAVTVALTGDGGDELFAGYSRFGAAVAAEFVPSPLRAAGRAILSRVHPGDRHGTLRERARRFALHASQPLPERLRNWVSLFTSMELQDLLTPEFAQYATPSSLGAAYDALDRKTGDADTLNRVLYLNARTYLLDDLNVKVDRASMAVGLETRAPFLDTALIEFAFGLPGRLKLRGTSMKWILKQAFKDLLPAEVVNRRKMGFGVPLGAWFRNELKSELRERLLAPDSRLNRYFREGALSKLLTAHDAGQRDLGLHFWGLWLVESWLRRTGAN
jgi:asparagine synthase (glutamine-hydrolysing)